MNKQERFYPNYPNYQNYPNFPGGHSPGLPPGTHIDPHYNPYTGQTHYDVHIPGPGGGIKLPFNPSGYYPHY